jgi:hypothetical protein
VFDYDKENTNIYILIILSIFMVEQINLQVLNCSRCGHKWIPRVASRMCPKCKSYYWNEASDFDRRKTEYKKEKIKEVKRNLIEEIQN